MDKEEQGVLPLLKVRIPLGETAANEALTQNVNSVKRKENIPTHYVLIEADQEKC